MYTVIGYSKKYCIKEHRWTSELPHLIFTFQTTAWGITLTYSKGNILSREQAPTLSWRTNWYVGVYGKVSDSVSVRHNDSACRRPLQHVRSPPVCLKWKQTAGPSSSFTTRLDITPTDTQRWALSLDWKNWISCTAFEKLGILSPYEEESKYVL